MKQIFNPNVVQALSCQATTTIQIHFKLGNQSCNFYNLQFLQFFLQFFLTNFNPPPDYIIILFVIDDEPLVVDLPGISLDIENGENSSHTPPLLLGTSSKFF
jgi:hypothetical protein